MHWSCDLKPTEKIPSELSHTSNDVLNHLEEGWDLIYRTPYMHIYCVEIDHSG